MNAGMLRAALGSNDLDQSLQHWRDTARYYLANDPTGEMGRSHPALARSLPSSFPEPHVVDLYAQPAVTPLAELPGLQFPTSPDVARLASLVQELLGWDSERLVSTFRTAIWPVVVLHELLEDLANNSPTSDEVCCCPMVIVDVLTGIVCRLTLPLAARGPCFTTVPGA